jgi:hypothetical protein
MLGLAAGALLAGVCGCGQRIADAAGKITYQGKPVVCGSVVFVGPDGMTKVGAIRADGSYEVKGVGAGRAQVAVFSLDPARPLNPEIAPRTHGKAATEPVDDSGRPADTRPVVASAPADRSNWAEPNVDRSRWFPLPKKYELVATSGLSAQLKAGPNPDVNFDLP